MVLECINVPVSILHSPKLTASAKVVWQVLQLDAHLERRYLYSPSRLVTITGLVRPTIRIALAQLATIKLDDQFSEGTQTVPMPVILLTDIKISSQAKVVYGALKATPNFQGSEGQFTYKSLSRQISIGTKTVRRAIHELVVKGWIIIRQAHQHAPTYFTTLDPTTTELLAAQRRLDKAEFKGEALMREYLNLLVDSEYSEDNSAPAFLINPYTHERLEFDRYYPSYNVAFEFNGPQHYRPTTRFDASTVVQQKRRDQIKQAICKVKNITLIYIHAEDLSLDTMKQKLGQLLPLRDISNLSRLVDFIEYRSRSYRSAVAAGIIC